MRVIQLSKKFDYPIVNTILFFWQTIIHLCNETKKLIESEVDRFGLWQV